MSLIGDAERSAQIVALTSAEIVSLILVEGTCWRLVLLLILVVEIVIVENTRQILALTLVVASCVISIFRAQGLSADALVLTVIAVVVAAHWCEVVRCQSGFE